MKQKLIIILSICISQYSFGGIDSTLIDSSKSLNNKGITCLRNDDFQNADKYFKASLELKKKIYGKESNISIAHAYNNIGLTNMRKWEYDSALLWFSKAEKVYSQFSDTKIHLANLYSNIGNIHRLIGDYSLAKQYYNNALKDLINCKSGNTEQKTVYVLKRLGLLEIQQGNITASIDYYEKALVYKDYINSSSLINLYENLGYSYSLLNYLNESRSYYMLGLNVAQQGLDYETHTARILQKLALLHISLDDKEKAIQYINKSKYIFDSRGVDSILYRNLFTNYGQIYEHFRDYENAIKYYQLALFITTPILSNNIYETPDVNKYQNTLFGISQLKTKAECLLRWNAAEPNDTVLQSALTALETATQLIDVSRSSYLSMESKLMLSENETPIYNLGIQSAYKLYSKTNNPEYLEKAFYFAEKNKSAVLSSVLHEEKAKSFSSIPKSLLEQEENLKRDISFYKERMYNESLNTNPDSAKIETWNNYLFTYIKEQDQLKQLLETEYPDYYTLKYQQRTLEIKDIQKLLNSNTDLIEYTITDSLLYVFHITKNHSEILEVKIDSSLLVKTYRFMNYFRNFSFMDQGNTVYKNLSFAGSELYKVLIGPLTLSKNTDHLIIIPDGILSYIPFETLITPDSSQDNWSYSSLNFLLRDYSISYSYSASLLHDTWAGKHRKIHNKLLAIAPKYVPAKTENIVQHGAAYTVGFRDNLLPIPFAMDEARLISQITRGKSKTGASATEENFLEEAGKYDILHLAMHTIIDDNNPLYSKLVFYDENYSSDNGLLTTNEIFDLNLNAKMTVLSSCSSGEGEIKKGEGVLSLARGFFYAGCPSLVMTLWKVDDESGLILMRNYYKYLIKGCSKPDALRKAKLDYINTVPNEKKHPFYWSAYICIGDPSPIYFSRHYIYIIVGIILIAVTLFVWNRKRKRKKQVLTEPNL